MATDGVLGSDDRLTTNGVDPEALRTDAADNYEIYGYWGISVFATVPGLDIEWIATTKPRRATWLVVFRAGDILAADLELWDTGQIIRNPSSGSGGIQ